MSSDLSVFSQVVNNNNNWPQPIYVKQSNRSDLDKLIDIYKNAIHCRENLQTFLMTFTPAAHDLKLKNQIKVHKEGLLTQLDSLGEQLMNSPLSVYADIISIPLLNCNILHIHCRYNYWKYCRDLSQVDKKEDKKDDMEVKEKDAKKNVKEKDAKEVKEKESKPVISHLQDQKVPAKLNFNEAIVSACGGKGIFDKIPTIESPLGMFALNIFEICDNIRDFPVAMKCQQEEGVYGLVIKRSDGNFEIFSNFKIDGVVQEEYFLIETAAQKIIKSSPVTSQLILDLANFMSNKNC